MGKPATGGWLAAVLVVEAAAVTACTFWTLRGCLASLRSPYTWLQLYTLDGSNLDVWAACVVKLALLLAVVAVAAGRWHRSRRQLSSFTDQCAAVASTAVVYIYQCAILAKAVYVAVFAPEQVLPSQTSDGDVGLLLLYLPIIVSSAASVAELTCLRRLFKEWGDASIAEQEGTEPLLGKPVATSKADEPRASPRTIVMLAKFSAVDMPLLVFAFTAGTVAALGQALIPYYTGQIIDDATIDPDRAAFQWTTLKLVAVTAACALSTGVRGGLFTVAMTRLNVRIRTRLFAALLQQEIGFFDTTRTGDITSRLSADTTTVSDQICLNLNVGMRSATQAAVVMVFMVRASWRLTIVTLVMVPLIILVCKWYGTFYRELAKAVQTELAAANAVAEEALGAMTTMRAHAAEAGILSEYCDKLQAFYRLQMKEALAYGLFMTTATFLPNTVNAAVLFVGGNLVLAGEMSAGALVAFMLYQQSLSAAFQALGDTFSSLSAAVGAAEKVMELIQRQPRIACAGGLTVPDFRGRLELQDVHLAYPARPAVAVLAGITLHVNPGEVLALVGPSGGGKSSIIRLLQRYYVPEQGVVLLDGRDVGTYNPHWLRRRMAIVAQEPVLFARSIRRNILLGLEPGDGLSPAAMPSHADVEAAARLANAHDFITACPSGYDTLVVPPCAFSWVDHEDKCTGWQSIKQEVGDRGVALSGGQKQRIAIARALVRRPNILLLDEATSALDSDSEAVVQEALDRVMRGYTVLVIAHRLSTVAAADRIIVVAKGMVVEEGRHDALMEEGGLYAQLARRQFRHVASSASMTSAPRAPSSGNSLQGLVVESGPRFGGSGSEGDANREGPLSPGSL